MREGRQQRQRRRQRGQTRHPLHALVPRRGTANTLRAVALRIGFEPLLFERPDSPTRRRVMDLDASLGIQTRAAARRLSMTLQPSKTAAARNARRLTLQAAPPTAAAATLAKKAVAKAAAATPLPRVATLAKENASRAATVKRSAAKPAARTKPATKAPAPAPAPAPASAPPSGPVPAALSLSPAALEADRVEDARDFDAGFAVPSALRSRPASPAAQRLPEPQPPVAVKSEDAPVTPRRSPGRQPRASAAKSATRVPRVVEAASSGAAHVVRVLSSAEELASVGHLLGDCKLEEGETLALVRVSRGQLAQAATATPAWSSTPPPVGSVPSEASFAPVLAVSPSPRRAAAPAAISFQLWLLGLLVVAFLFFATRNMRVLHAKTEEWSQTDTWRVISSTCRSALAAVSSVLREVSRGAPTQVALCEFLTRSDLASQAGAVPHELPRSPPLPAAPTPPVL